jgi:hypothetical protein
MACALDGAQDFSGSVLVSSIVMAVPRGSDSRRWISCSKKTTSRRRQSVGRSVQWMSFGYDIATRRNPTSQAQKRAIAHGERLLSVIRHTTNPTL